MSKKPTLMPKAERAEAALQSAMKLAKKVGARRVSMAMVAVAQKVTAPLLFGIFKSREGLTRAILKEAKKQGITLPEPKPTIREAREAAKKGKPVKKLAVAKKAAPKKLAALLRPAPAVPRKRSIKEVKEVKAIKDKLAAKATRTDAHGKTTAMDFKGTAAAPAPTRKPLTPAQRQAKAERDRIRRAATPAEKFAALPTPFQASVESVS